MDAEIHGRPTAVWPASSSHARKPRAARSRKRPKSYPEPRLIKSRKPNERLGSDIEAPWARHVPVSNSGCNTTTILRLFLRPLHLAGVEIIIAPDYPQLSCDLGEFSLLSNRPRDAGSLLIQCL